MEQVTVGVVGGGAAGMMAAITAARQGAQVTLLERNDRVGRKLLMTGNGRCNLGNRELSADAYYGADPKWIQDCLNRFDTEDTICFFQGIGLFIKEKNGMLYPVSNQAGTVLDVLRYEMKSLGIKVVTGCKIERIKREKQFRLYADGGEYLFDKVILACGGKAAPGTGSDGTGYRLAEQLGHHIIPTVPALVQLRCREDYFKSVAGVRTDAKLTVLQGETCAAEEWGELQLTNYGISGIPVFQLSRTVAYLLQEQKEVKIRIQLLPEYSEADLELLLVNRLILMGDRTVEEFFTGILHKSLMGLFIRLAGLKNGMLAEQADRQALLAVFFMCRDWTVTVNGTNSYDNAQVSAGGIPAAEVTGQMESRLIPGLYFAGEMLDVDGRCGGYNLQWAWCSGYLAGMAVMGEKR